VRDAIALDGGGASAMVIANQGGLVSSPSDGVQRPVANHLGIAYGAQPPVSLIGNIFDSVFGGPALAGVLVTLDTGATDTTGTDGRYTFTVPPRYACVTASKTGYNTITQCKQLEAGMQNFNSIVMFPIGQGVDAGTVDAGNPDGSTPDDAATGDGAGGSDGAGTDAGDEGGGGDGCCSTGTHGAEPTGVAALALVVVFGLCGRGRIQLLRRTRRT
jgi:hypothetical protein